MKRSFREPKNLFKNKAKNSCRKMNSLKITETLENKEKFQGKKRVKKPDIPHNTAQIRLSGESKVD